MPAWRFRLCLHCFTVRPAGQFTCLTYGSNWRTEGTALRSCPRCGHVAQTSRFPVVRDDRHPELVAFKIDGQPLVKPKP